MKACGDPVPKDELGCCAAKIYGVTRECDWKDFAKHIVHIFEGDINYSGTKK